MVYSNLKFASYNCRGLRNADKRHMVFAYLHRHKLDIISIQETHSVLSDERRWRTEWGNDIIFSHGTNTSKGVAVLFRADLSPTVSKKITDVHGRFIILDITVNNDIFTFVCVYGPNIDNATFFHTVYEHLESLKCDNIICGGDFNFVFNLTLDKYGGVQKTNFKARDACLSYLDKFSLDDVWRTRNPLSSGFTWTSNIDNIPCRLDFFLISKKLVNKVIDCYFQPPLQSDHQIVILHCDISTEPRGPGYWKFNNSLLLDPAYIDLVNSLISNYSSDPHNLNQNPASFWEGLKFTIRNNTIRFSKLKANDSRIYEKNLIKKIAQLESDSMSDENLLRELKDARNNLHLLYKNKLEGIMIRSKARWVEEGKQNSKYFLSLEKRNKQYNTIYKLNDTRDIPLTINSDILSHIRDFYTELYSSHYSNPDICFSLLPDFQSIVDYDLCEGPLDITECSSALFSMPNGKSPGSDGFSTDFYKKFWPSIGTFVLNSLNYAFELQMLSCEQRRGIITLIPKPEKDPCYIANYRPIALLNTDYKIAAKAIASRLKKVLSSLIGNTQTGFMSNRFIGENVRFVLDLIDYSNHNNIPGFLFFLDFEKAFDTLEWNFIYATLHYFKFGNNFTTWVRTFYNNTNSCIFNNGFSTGYFPVNRGVRQGCPLSPYLFILCTEILARVILNNAQIQGITILSCETKLLQYADDTVLFLNGDRRSLELTIQLLHDFRRASGLKINLQKSHLFPLGPFLTNHPTFISYFNLSLHLGPVKFLGITFTHNGDDLYRLNYVTKLSRLKNILNVWSTRDLTPVGRNIIVKSFALSQLVYLFQVLPDPPDSFINEVQTTIFDFLFGQKTRTRSEEGQCTMIIVTVD
ncbi:hypothetical protein HOLleu_13759 [Holothuria leucospilota]|uniref:Reverse transcriptase domain-containing protein n=1 Tax=Holothuria leucospilota TaxID=206669 RepID=A0A9Q1C7W8_HOLLE|nr:hypothetical protein HOLleu_13759 [Holothuria leucospilota]